ncbi:MAG: 4Fe-4S dicluster domain-containing protein [Actinomycetota bacterium]|nr:4Fe-4S dicluster domain-containing protein [Actinomycetota bacterium]
MSNSLFGPLDPALDAGWTEKPKPRVGFFTDTSVCIGCKACEVACKTWNALPEDGINLLGMSFDNTGSLGANSWRHVAFIEQPKQVGHQDPGLDGLPVGAPVTDVLNRALGEAVSKTDTNPLGTADEQVDILGNLPQGGVPIPAAAPGLPPRPPTDPSGPSPAVELGMPGSGPPGATGGAEGRSEFRWLMESNVCKHCTHAGCLDVCPTGALFRTEFGTVVVQQDICNGCGYCIPACPYGVIDQRKDPSGGHGGKVHARKGQTGGDEQSAGSRSGGHRSDTYGVGLAQKCTLCYDRLKDDLTPACAQACPTQSIQFGELDELRERAAKRVEVLHEAGVADAQLYGHDPNDGVGGTGAFFLLLDQPEVYGFPPDPVVPTKNLPVMWRQAGFAAAALVAGAVAAFAGARR